MSHGCWNLDSNHATWHSATVSVTTDLRRPDAGLAVSLVSDDSLVGRVLCLQVSPHEPASLEPSDSYVRGSDLVVTYRENSDRPYQTQIYWRALQSRDTAVVGWERLVAVHTSLLHSGPTMVSSSEVTAAEVFAVGDGQIQSLAADAAESCLLCRGIHDGSSLVELAPASELGSWQVEPSSAGQIRFSRSLFQADLEKGVILKSRGRVWLTPRENDVQVATDLHQQMLESRLPLST